MSYKKRTYDTDEITLRKVFAKSDVDNTNIPGMRVLTADGAGATYWAIPSTLGMNPSFNQINTTAGNFKADLSYNIFRITTNDIGSAQGPGKNNLVLYNQSFNEVDVSGNNTLHAFDSNTQQLQTTLRFAGTNGINIRSDPINNTVYFDSIGVPVSTSLYSFQKARVLSNISSIYSDISTPTGYFLNAASPSAALTFVGLGDVELFPDGNNNAIWVSLNQSTGSISSLTSLIQGISTGYVTNQQFSTGVGAVSTIAYSNFSTSVSTSYGINSNLSITVFNLPFNQYTLLAQYNAGFSNLAVGISTISTNYTPLPALFSTSIGINNRISTFNIPSSVCTVNVYGGNVTGFTAGVVIYDPADLSTFSTTYGVALNNMSITTTILTFQVSTLSTLATAGLSSLSTAITLQGNSNVGSTLRGLGSAGYVSTQTLYSSIIGLGSAGYISSQSLYSSIQGLDKNFASTTAGLGTSGYISSSSLYSSLQGLGTFGFLSSLSSSLISTRTIILSSITFRDTSLDIDQLLAVKNNQLQLNGAAITGGGGSGIQFFSTSFTSTIFFMGNQPTVYATPDGTDTGGFFSTANVYLDKFSTYINNNSKVFIDYYYNLVLSKFNAPGSPLLDYNADLPLYSFSTGILYNKVLDYNNVLTDVSVYTIPTYNINYATTINYSNVISRSQRFQLNTNNVIQTYGTPLEVFHYIKGFYNEGDGSNYYFSGFNSSTVRIYANPNTAISVSIQN